MKPPWYECGPGKHTRISPLTFNAAPLRASLKDRHPVAPFPRAAITVHAPPHSSVAAEEGALNTEYCVAFPSALLGLRYRVSFVQVRTPTPSECRVAVPPVVSIHSRYRIPRCYDQHGELRPPIVYSSDSIRKYRVVPGIMVSTVASV